MRVLSIKNFFSLSLMVFFLSFADFVVYAEYVSTVDYIQKTGRLWGIQAVLLNEDKSITLIDTKDSGYGFALWIPDGKGGAQDQATLKMEESVDLIDGHHVFIQYKYLGLEEGKIVIEVTDTFDARSFGHELEQVQQIFVIDPYQTSGVKTLVQG